MTIETWVIFLAVGVALFLLALYFFLQGIGDEDEHKTMHEKPADRLYVTITADIHLSLGPLEQKAVLARNLRLFAKNLDDKNYGLLATETAYIGDSTITYKINEWV